MTKEEWLRKLEQEGFEELRVCPVPPNEELPEHTHDVHTVHVILSGGLEIKEGDTTNTYTVGERVDFPAGTTHQARGTSDDGVMIVGEKEK